MSRSHAPMPGDPAEFKPEEALEPDMEIVDSHHHLHDPGGGHSPYLFDELRADVSAGHNVIATVAVEVGDMFRAYGPYEFRPVGETEFFGGIAAMFASGKYGRTLACAGIVGFADLRLGDRIQPVLDAHIEAGSGRFRGIRIPRTWRDAYLPPQNRQAARAKVELPQLLNDPGFRAGLACLAPRDLSFEIAIYHDQIADLVALSRAFSGTTIIIDHLAAPLGVGPHAGKYKELFSPWRSNLRDLAACRNVFIKLGGLRKAGVSIPGYSFGELGEFAVQPGSSEFAKAWRPYIETCIEAFGPGRCMFESNFPPEKVVCSYVGIWNAFKRITAGYSAADRAALFSGTATKAYRLHIPAREA